MQMERICEISQIRYLPVSSRCRKKRNLRTDDSLRGPGGASLPAANVPVVLPSSTRPIRRGFPSLAAPCRECVTHRESTRVFFPSALGGTFLRFSSAPPLLFLSLSLPSQPFAFFFSLRRQMLLTALTLMRSWFPPLPASQLFHPFPSPSPIHLPRKRRDRATRSFYSPERGGTTDSLYSPNCSCYCGRADDHSWLGAIAEQNCRIKTTSFKREDCIR